MKLILTFVAGIVFGLTFAVAASAQDTADAAMERAIVSLQAGNNEKAIADITEAIKLRPDFADAYLLRSNLKAVGGDSVGALADVNKVIELKPDSGAAYYGRAMLRLGNDDVPGALQDVGLAINNKYTADAVYDMRSMLRQQQGDTKGAIADLDIAIKQNANNPNYYARRANLRFMAQEQAGALADLIYLLTWYETDPTKRTTIGAAVAQLAPGNASKANAEAVPKETKVELAVSSVAAAPGDKEMAPIIARAYVTRGLIYRDRGNVDAAIADFTKSIRIVSTDAQVLIARAMEYEKKADWVAAMSDVNKAIELEPRVGNHRVEHGIILLQQGKPQEAQADFDMLLKVDPVLWQKRIDERMAAIKKK